MALKSLASKDVLAETRERLLRVTAVDTPLWGVMTATQMVRHLSCSCEVALGDRSVSPMKGMPPAMMKFLALRVSAKWPKNVKTTPEVYQAVQEPCSAEFPELLHVAAERMDELAGGQRWAKSHPMFGPMKPEDWMRWGYLHTDHHLRQFGR